MLLKYFRSFYSTNYPNDMEQCIDAFSVFGGFYEPLNLDLTIKELIRTEILLKYEKHYNYISAIVQNDRDTRYLLMAIAIGDRRIDSALKKAHLSRAKGAAVLEFLHQNSIIEVERSREKIPKKIYPKQQLKREIARHRISHKLRFKIPFLRFWFYFIEPHHKDIKNGNFQTTLDFYERHCQAFSGYVFEELSNLLLVNTHESKIINSGSYWDKNVEIDILALTQKMQIIVGECKWTNHKVNKKELHKLEDKCDKLQLTPDLIVLFSKRGFSNELVNCADDKLKLYKAEDFKVLLTNNS